MDGTKQWYLRSSAGTLPSEKFLGLLIVHVLVSYFTIEENEASGNRRNSDDTALYRVADRLDSRSNLLRRAPAAVALKVRTT